VSTVLPAPRAILFDWDGTLVDNWGVIHGALNDVLEAHGMARWTREEAMERISRSQRDSFPTIFGPRWQDARDAFYRNFEARHLADMVVLPGAAALLAGLRADGIALAVVSNKQGGYLRRESTHLGWDGHFVSLIGAGDAPNDKPSADPVHLALKETGVPAGPDVWFIGDSSTDIATAFASGCTAILIQQPGGNPTPLPEGLHPAVTVDDLAAIAALASESRRPV
jgi:phosphoglycolate phosphatase